MNLYPSSKSLSMNPLVRMSKRARKIVHSIRVQRITDLFDFDRLDEVLLIELREVSLQREGLVEHKELLDARNLIGRYLYRVFVQQETLR